MSQGTTPPAVAFCVSMYTFFTSKASKLRTDALVSTWKTPEHGASEAHARVCVRRRLRHVRAQRHYLYFCTSKARKPRSTWTAASLFGAAASAPALSLSRY
jgi:hypothetical protein